MEALSRCLTRGVPRLTLKDSMQVITIINVEPEAKSAEMDADRSRSHH